MACSRPTSEVVPTGSRRETGEDGPADAAESGSESLAQQRRQVVATSPLLEGISGRYFADCNEAPVVDSTFTGPPRGFGVAPYALDPDNASRLWDLSLDLTD